MLHWTITSFKHTIIHVTNSALNYYLHTLHVLSHYHIALQHAYLYIAITTHISHYYLFLKIWINCINIPGYPGLNGEWVKSSAECRCFVVLENFEGIQWKTTDSRKKCAQSIALLPDDNLNSSTVTVSICEHTNKVARPNRHPLWLQNLMNGKLLWYVA